MEEAEDKAAINLFNALGPFVRIARKVLRKRDLYELERMVSKRYTAPTLEEYEDDKAAINLFNALDPFVRIVRKVLGKRDLYELERMVPK